MNIRNYYFLSTFFLFSILGLSGCGSSSKATAQDVSQQKGMDISQFKKNAFIQEPKIIDCETAEGTKTTCYQLVSSGGPAGREPGPFCPRTTTDGAEAGGGWFKKEETGDLVDISGEFILNLSNYYDDEKWKLYDLETNKIRYTDNKQSCFGAAKPNVEEEFKQNCIECLMSYLDDDFKRTYLIPTTPIPTQKKGGRMRTAGIALDGAELSGPAPIDAILGSYTIAAFDDCGGHINAHQGYHYHASTGCTDKHVHDDGHAPLVGFAPDGYGIYALKNPNGETESLDECRGTTDKVRGYHYHASSPSENMIINCLHGESVRPARKRHGGKSGDKKPSKKK